MRRLLAFLLTLPVATAASAADALGFPFGGGAVFLIFFAPFLGAIVLAGMMLLTAGLRGPLACALFVCVALALAEYFMARGLMWLVALALTPWLFFGVMFACYSSGKRALRATRIQRPAASSGVTRDS